MEIKAIRMSDDLIVFVEVPDRLLDESIARYEYSHGSDGKRIRAVTTSGIVLILDIHSVIKEGV